MRDVTLQLKSLLSKDGVAVFVIGDVAKSKTSVIPLAREFIFMVRELKIFKNAWCINDNIGAADKTTKIWAETKGKATATDRIVFLSDINPFKKFQDNDSIEKMDYATINKLTKCFLG